MVQPIHTTLSGISSTLFPAPFLFVSTGDWQPPTLCLITATPPLASHTRLCIFAAFSALVVSTRIPSSRQDCLLVSPCRPPLKLPLSLPVPFNLSRVSDLTPRPCHSTPFSASFIYGLTAYPGVSICSPISICCSSAPGLGALIPFRISCVSGPQINVSEGAFFIARPLATSHCAAFQKPNPFASAVVSSLPGVLHRRPSFSQVPRVLCCSKTARDSRLIAVEMSSMLRKKEVFTIITPIPGFIPRQLAIDILHSHSEVITLNPLVLDHKPIKAPRNAAADEYYSTWYEINQRIQYVPGIGKIGSGKISFNGCFHDMPWGLQTHIYAPMNVDLKNRYRIAGNQPGIEPPEQQEIGLAQLGAPSDGLYLRDDVEIKCNVAVVSFVKAQLKSASKDMVSRIIKKAELLDAGVLQGMIENGKLRTHNPMDRSSSSAGMSMPPHNGSASGTTSPRPKYSPTFNPYRADGTYSPEPNQPTPYQVPRPMSYQQQQQQHQGYNRSPGGHYSAPYGGMPTKAGDFAYRPNQAAHAELPGPLSGGPVMPVEMPGDYHFQPGHMGGPATPPQPSPTYPSDRDSSISNYSSQHASRWSQSQQGSTISRPTSVQSDASGGAGNGAGGMHSPGLPTHAEAPEHDEQQQQPQQRRQYDHGRNDDALRKLDPAEANSRRGTAPPPLFHARSHPNSHAYAYNPADYVSMGGRSQSAQARGHSGN